MKKFLLQTSQHLKPPRLENKERKLVIGPHDVYYESTFSRFDLSALYFNFLPIEGPFIIIPCISQNKDSDVVEYDMTIYSNGDLYVEPLDDNKNIACIDEWEQGYAGGCHLYTDKYFQSEDETKWNSNPQYLLKFSTTAPAKAKITLKLVKKKQVKGAEEIMGEGKDKKKVNLHLLYLE